MLSGRVAEGERFRMKEKMSKLLFVDIRALFIWNSKSGDWMKSKMWDVEFANLKKMFV